VAHIFVRSSVPGTADAANTLGWFDAIDAPTPDHGDGGTWNVVWGANDKANLLPPGESGSFSFTTPVCGLGHVAAEAGEADDNFEALGQLLGPVATGNSVSATLDSFIPVNANDDNGSAWAQVQMPDGRMVDQPGIPRRTSTWTGRTRGTSTTTPTPTSKTPSWCP
jgi:hypothetical protein